MLWHLHSYFSVDLRVAAVVSMLKLSHSCFALCSFCICVVAVVFLLWCLYLCHSVCIHVDFANHPTHPGHCAFILKPLLSVDNIRNSSNTHQNNSPAQKMFGVSMVTAIYSPPPFFCITQIEYCKIFSSLCTIPVIMETLARHTCPSLKHQKYCFYLNAATD